MPGRALYLKERGFHVEFVQFVDASITKENQCLVARRPPGGGRA